MYCCFVKRNNYIYTKTLVQVYYLQSHVFFCVVMLSRITQLGEWTFDFENAKQADQWKVANGTWKIQNGVYSETSAKEKATHVLFGEDDWADYTIEARIRLDAGGRWDGLVLGL